MAIVSISFLSKQEFPWQADLGGGLGKIALTKEGLLSVCPEAAEWLAANTLIVISDEDQDAKRNLRDARIRRNDALAATDHLMTRDSPLSEVELQEVIDYRQALRDYPATSIWPVKPPVLN